MMHRTNSTRIPKKLPPGSAASAVMDHRMPHTINSARTAVRMRPNFPWGGHNHACLNLCPQVASAGIGWLSVRHGWQQISNCLQMAPQHTEQQFLLFLLLGWWFTWLEADILVNNSGCCCWFTDDWGMSSSCTAIAGRIQWLGQCSFLFFLFFPCPLFSTPWDLFECLPEYPITEKTGIVKAKSCELRWKWDYPIHCC